MHRRIPKKNRKKLKSVDPFNVKGQVIREANKIKGKNNAPKVNDDQPVPKSLKKIMESTKIVDKSEVKKIKKEKNAIIREADRLGIKKGRFETMKRFLKRVEQTMHRNIQENISIAQKGLAGRNQLEIDADYAKLDEKEKRRKEQEKREIQNKIKEARKRREQEEMKREEALKAKMERKRKKMEGEEVTEEADEKPEEREEAEEESVDEDDDDDDEPKNKKEKLESSSKPKALNKKERRKMQQKKIKEDQHTKKYNDHVLNEKEHIAFGERYDAPPVFGGKLKSKFEPLMAKAGQKNLLLHSVLKKGNESTTYLENKKEATTMEEERLRVIEAYRQMKKGKK